MVDKPARTRSLSRILAIRVCLFAGLAILVQMSLVFVDYYFGDAELASLMVESEASHLADGVRMGGAGLQFKLPDNLHRYREWDGSYVTRIRAPSGAVLYSNCNERCVLHLLPQEINPPDLWSRMLGPGKPITVAGGMSFNIGNQKVFVELAILDDHEGVMWRVLGHEFANHLAVPMSLMLVFVLGGILWSIREALKPVERAAREAEGIDPLDPSHRIDIAGMPREVADLGSAVNRTLSRVHNLMMAQRAYTTAVAHEIRTPLAMMKLELEHIDHPRARKIEEDLDSLARFVGQITALGRLEGADRAGFGPVELTSLAQGLVADIAPWVYSRRHRIAFEDRGAGCVDGDALLIVDAVRNLIENAVRHTPEETTIDVIVDTSTLLVVDDAGLYPEDVPEAGLGRADHLGVGLQIVRRIVELHGGSFRIDVEAGRKTTMRLDFGSLYQLAKKLPPSETIPT